MSQFALFDSAPRVLHDDIRGRFVYTPDVATPDESARWFDELAAVAPWKRERRRMYERDVDVPRLTAHYGLAGEDGAALPAAIVAAHARVVALTGVAFNSVGLNHYRDGRDSVAMHHDHLYELVAGEPIALLSLGAPRRMTIRAIAPPAHAFAVDLAPGSVLEMNYATQLHYLHGIPKTTKPVGPRISLAFRVRPADVDRARARRGFYDAE